MNPIDELVKAAEATNAESLCAINWLRDALDCKNFVWDGDQRDAADECVKATQQAINALRAAIPAAKLYAERMGEVEKALNGTVVPTIPRKTGTTWQDGFTTGAEAVRDHLRDLLASLDAPTDSGAATVGPDARCVIDPAYLTDCAERMETWDRHQLEVQYMNAVEAVWVLNKAIADQRKPTATAKETNDES